MEQTTEQLIKETGADKAPRVTPERIKEVQEKVEFFHPTGTLMICVITLKNGFSVTGQSACASPENFNEIVGQKVSRENAEEQIWPLEGYLLKQRLYENALPKSVV
jgi:hypothetical protein